MPYTIYARGTSHRFQNFVEELLGALATRGIEASKIVRSTGEASMNVKKTDESGSLKLLTRGKDIEIVYTTSGGLDDTFKGAIGGALGGRGGAGAVFDMLKGALRGREEDRSEATVFAKELSEAVKEAEYGVQKILEREKEILEKPPAFVEDVSFQCDCGYVFTYEKIRDVVSGGEIRCPYCRKVYRKR